MTHYHCPECGETSTKEISTEITPNVIERSRKCLNCPTKYTVSYENPRIVHVETEVDD
jgi:transcriptional regulator NrdR family protein